MTWLLRSAPRSFQRQQAADSLRGGNPLCAGRRAGGIGASGSDTLNYTAFQWRDELMWVKGWHTLGFGGTV
jgi:hypothetical protein